MIHWCLYLLLAALVLPRVSIQECTMEEFKDKNALDLLQVTELSEDDQNFTVQDIIYNCLSTSRIIGLYRSMSVSVLYIRSDTPDQLRDVRYDLWCKNYSEWLRYGQHRDGFNSSETRFDCSDCVMDVNISDHHCTR